MTVSTHHQTSWVNPYIIRNMCTYGRLSFTSFLRVFNMLPVQLQSKKPRQLHGKNYSLVMTVSIHIEPCQFGSSFQIGMTIKIVWTCLKPSTKSGLGTLHTWRLTTPQATKLATIRTELHCNSGCFQRETSCFAGQRSESLSRMGFSRLELPFDSLWVIIETAAFSCKALKAFKWLRAWQVSQGVRGVKKTKERFEVSSQAYQGAYP